MNQFSVDMESAIESELINLDAVSMATLRMLDNAAIKRALRHVMQRIGRPQVTADSEAERID